MINRAGCRVNDSSFNLELPSVVEVSSSDVDTIRIKEYDMSFIPFFVRLAWFFCAKIFVNEPRKRSRNSNRATGRKNEDSWQDKEFF
jgi:hypothetical protein